MKRFLIIGLFIFPLIFNCAKNDRGFVDKIKLLQGIWVNEEDENWVFKFENQKVIEYYKGELLNESDFELSYNSCDNIYYDGNSKENLFLNYNNEETNCFEIIVLNYERLVYRETETEKVKIFKRVIKSKTS